MPSGPVAQIRVTGELPDGSLVATAIETQSGLKKNDRGVWVLPSGPWRDGLYREAYVRFCLTNPQATLSEIKVILYMRTKTNRSAR